MPTVKVDVPLRYIDGTPHYKGQTVVYSVEEWAGLSADDKAAFALVEWTDLLGAAGDVTSSELITALAPKQDASSAATDAEMATHAADTLLHSSGQRTGLAVNETGTGLTLTTASAVVAGTSVAAPSIARPQVLEAKCIFKFGTVMTADTSTSAFLLIVDDLGNFIETGAVTFTGATNSCWGTCEFTADIPAGAAARTYHLEAYRNGSTTGSIVLMNGLISAGNRTRLRIRAA